MESTRFSYYFNFLKYMGIWVIETKNPTKRKLYHLYSFLGSSIIMFVTYTGVLDMYDSLNNFRKLSYNLCMNFMMFGNWTKSMQNFHKSGRINNLRKILHRDFDTCWDDEERAIYKSTERQFINLEKFFYIVLVVSYPGWLLQSFFSYLWGPRYLPLPSRWPGVLNEPSSYNYIFLFHAVFAVVYLLNILAMDMSMFSLLMQLHREYCLMIKRMNDCTKYFKSLEENDVSRPDREVNAILKKRKTKSILRKFVVRQTQLIGYTEEFEYGYNLALLIQIFGGGFLIVINGVETLIVSLEFSVRMSYQIGYVLVILADFSYLCLLVDRVATKCIEVGTAVYEMPWYDMDLETQRDILTIILRAQKPPQVTAGKVLALNLPAFTSMMKNIYSWLALYRQVGFT